MDSFFNLWNKATEAIGNGIVAVIGVLFGLLTIYIKNLAPKIVQKKDRKVIQVNIDNLKKAIRETQKLTLKIGAIRGHILYYQNHGPERVSVYHECMGSPCPGCVSHCRFKDSIVSVADTWETPRRIHHFWLMNVVGRTIHTDGVVTATMGDAIRLNDQQQIEIWQELGTWTVKECLIKTKSSHDFYTVCFEFCERLKNPRHVDASIKNLASALYKLL